MTSTKPARPRPLTAKQKKEAAAREAFIDRAIMLSVRAWTLHSADGLSPKQIAAKVKPEMTAVLAERAWWLSKVNLDQEDKFWGDLAKECDKLVDERNGYATAD